LSRQELYPLKFNPILKSTIWGGNKLNTILNKPSLGDDPVGESWEISGVKNNVSVVANGILAGKNLIELIREYKGDLLGDTIFKKFGEEFPLLIKFIDANQDLSIQVHPNDSLARKRHGSFGKTEMWYVVDAEEGATLISGFNKSTNREEYLAYFNSGRLLDLLNREQVHKDDVYYLPAGRVHTIGKGLLITEIQQTSDITYRIYDFDRVDKNGNKRQLHIEEAIDAIDYKFYTNYKTAYNRKNKDTRLVSSEYFITNRLLISESTERNYRTKDSFIIFIILEGSGVMEYSGGSIAYNLGDTFLLPALIEIIVIKPNSLSKLVEVFVS